jgi:phage/plasmid-like protein (TIGR03299 family)
VPAQIDGTKAAYARTPAWHRIGTVFDGLMTAEQCLAIMNPSGKKILKGRAYVEFVDEKDNVHNVESDEHSGVVDFDSDTGLWRVLSFNSKEYGIVQLDEQFRLMDEIVNQVDGAHYDAGVRLRNGKQVALSAYLGDKVLDELGIADVHKRFLWGFNSFDTSWALRCKWGDYRVECANMAAMALRGSTDTDVQGSDWSTRHTTNVMGRVDEAKRVLGLMQQYEDEYWAECEQLIHTPLKDNDFQHIVEGLFVSTKDDEQIPDVNAVEQVRVLYELSPANQNIFGTAWGGLNAVTEYADWYTKVRGSAKTGEGEMRFRKQMESPLKQEAWDRFRDLVTTP